MLSEPSVLCWVSPTHTILVLGRILGFVLIVFPYMTLVWFGIWKHHRNMARLATSPNHLRMFRFLFLPFKPEVYYFGACTTLRAVGICLVPVIFRDRASLQILAMATIISVFQLGVRQIGPWFSKRSDLVDGALATMMSLLLICGALSTDARNASELVAW